MYRFLPLIFAMGVAMPNVQAQDSAPAEQPEVESQIPIGYFLGLSMGQQLRSKGIQPADLDADNVVAGINDALADKIDASDAQLQEVAQRLQQLVNERFGQRMEQKLSAGKQWLAENLEKEGVKELTGGLQYKELKAGDGASPSSSDNVRVHYTGKLINGEVFDSSVQRGEPAEFVVGQVIKGWQMALQEMKVGDKWMLYIPPELAYGQRGSQPAIGPNEVLIFEVELLDIL